MQVKKKIHCPILKKNGQLRDIVVFFIIIFAVGLTVILGRYILGSVYDSLDEAGITTVASNESRTTMEGNFAVFDYSLVAMAIIMIVGLMVTSFLIPSHPIFLVINIVGIFLLIFLGMIMTNVYGEIVSGDNATLQDTADQYTMFNFLMENLAYFGAIAIFLSSIIMYSRSR